MAKKPKDDPTTDATAPIARALKLTVFAKTPMWRGPRGWDMQWPAGETIVAGEDLAARDPEIVELMIERLDEDPNFTVAVEREKVEG